MDTPLIFDKIEATTAVFGGTSHGGQRYRYRSRVRHLFDGQVVSEVDVLAHLTASGYVQAQTPVEEFVTRAIVSAAGCCNDGRKLQVLLDRVGASGGSLYVRPPADPQDCGQPLEPRFALPAMFT
jgi:hypothetical protein